MSEINKISEYTNVYHATNLMLANKILESGKIGISTDEYKSIVADIVYENCNDDDANAVMNSLILRGRFHADGSFDPRGGVSFWPTKQQILCGGSEHAYAMNTSARGGEFHSHLIEEIFRTIARRKKIKWKEFSRQVKDQIDALTGRKSPPVMICVELPDNMLSVKCGKSERYTDLPVSCEYIKYIVGILDAEIYYKRGE